MPTIFSKIISGEIPSYKVAENEDFLAFLDINPNSIGHTLCIPKKEIDNILDLDEKTYLELMKFSRKVALSIVKVIDCERVSFSVIGLEVPHVHVHLIPIKKMSDANFTKKVFMNDNQFKQTASLISDAFKSV
jgi:histidine triad (HIT) family protein